MTHRIYKDGTRCFQTPYIPLFVEELQYASPMGVDLEHAIGPIFDRFVLGTVCFVFCFLCLVFFVFCFVLVFSHCLLSHIYPTPTAV